MGITLYWRLKSYSVEGTGFINPRSDERDRSFSLLRSENNEISLIAIVGLINQIQPAVPAKIRYLFNRFVEERFYELPPTSPSCIICMVIKLGEWTSLISSCICQGPTISSLIIWVFRWNCLTSLYLLKYNPTVGLMIHMIVPISYLVHYDGRFRDFFTAGRSYRCA